ncbi:MAG: hypothetical protein M0P91_04495 [Sulfuricurvum sp.]|jgi:hypothetical protein|uniref:hypothetical protein n=1 Tax=Sulfuricurvum sp. TaxID=2025608 RepID=UPI0025FE3B7F|nr:hypothetical protein [Sulfuricurvum sp.]MCK9372434.1 hypothetical protein [Sulfuricurvum sp.]
MAKKDNKIGKTVWLTPSTMELIEGYAGVSGENFSNAAESLIMRGLDNILLAENLSKTIRNELKEIRKENRQNTDRIAGLLINMTRFMGKIYSINLLGFIRVKAFQNEELKENNIYEIEKIGIQKAMKDLKYKQDNLGEEIE